MSIMDAIDNAVRLIKECVSRESKEVIDWCARIDKKTGRGLKYYKLLSYDGRAIYPADCHDMMMSDDTLHEFRCNHDILVGDYIRVIDETYHMGMAKVVKRVFSANDKTMFLYCVNVDEQDDYLYTFQYERDCKDWFDYNKKDIEAKMERCKDNLEMCAHTIVVDLVKQVNVEKRTSVDYWNILSRTKEIVYPLFGLEYQRPSRYSFDMD